MAQTEKKRWLFRARVVDRAGALTSITSVFSSRGISLDTVAGHGAEHAATGEGTVLVSFRSTEREKNVMRRLVERLSKVHSVEEHPYLAEHLRKSALLRVAPGLEPADVIGHNTTLTCELVDEDSRGKLYFIAGSPAQVDPVIERLKSAGVLSDVVYSVCAL
jgi:acetolactate synthase small subunit